MKEWIQTTVFNHSQNNLKIGYEPKHKTWNHKGPRRKHRGKLLDISNNTKAQATKPKVNKRHEEHQKLLLSKETISKMKKHLREWEKMSEITQLIRCLLSKTYKELIQLKRKKANYPIKRCTKDLNEYFSKEDIQMTGKYMKRYLSTSLLTREM